MHILTCALIQAGHKRQKFQIISRKPQPGEDVKFRLPTQGGQEFYELSCARVFAILQHLLNEIHAALCVLAYLSEAPAVGVDRLFEPIKPILFHAKFVARCCGWHIYVIACIDLHANACDRMLPMSKILTDIDAFIAETGLSEHRVGILLANNGRLIPRLRRGGRVWPETEQAIREAMIEVRQKRATNTGTEDAA